MGCLETRLAANEVDWAGLTMLASAAIIVTEQQVDRSRSRWAESGSLSSNLVVKLVFQLSGASRTIRSSWRSVLCPMSVETLHLQGPGEHARQKCQSLAVSSSLTMPLGLGKARERWALEKMAHPGRPSFNQHPTHSAAWSLGHRGGCSSSSFWTTASFSRITLVTESSRAISEADSTSGSN